MKKSTEKIMNVLPSNTLEHSDFKELNRTETTLTKLALFFENPKENSFDLQDLYSIEKGSKNGFVYYQN